MHTAVDLDIGLSWILKDPNYFSKLSTDGKDYAHFKISEDELVDELHRWINELGLKIKLAELFHCSPGKSIFVHSDILEPPHICCKLNWVYGVDGMDWYQLKPGIELEYHNNTIGGHYWATDPKNYELYINRKVNRPSLVNVSDLHGIRNNSNESWWCLSLVLKKQDSDEHRIHWNELYEKVKPWIKTE